VLLRLHSRDIGVQRGSVELTIRYAGPRLMGITRKERVEILDPDGRTHDWDGRGAIPAGRGVDDGRRTRCLGGWSVR
jgi:hypothetical protein